MAASFIPHSFVLADLFDVQAMSYPVPDHVLEDEPWLAWTECPMCEGERWVEGSASVRTGKPTARPCPRCNGRGEVLSDFPTIPMLEPTLKRAA